MSQNTLPNLDGVSKLPRGRSNVTASNGRTSSQLYCLSVERIKPRVVCRLLVNCVHSSAVNSASTFVPVNTAVNVGATVQFACQSPRNSTFRWYHFRPRINRQTVVFSGSQLNSHDYDSRFNATYDVATRATVLRIDNVQLTDAGVYCCFELTATTSQKHSAELIVLGETFNGAVSLSLRRNWAVDFRLRFRLRIV